jgi:hypothetical protein
MDFPSVLSHDEFKVSRQHVQNDQRVQRVSSASVSDSVSRKCCSCKAKGQITCLDNRRAAGRFEINLVPGDILGSDSILTEQNKCHSRVNQYVLQIISACVPDRVRFEKKPKMILDLFSSLAGVSDSVPDQPEHPKELCGMILGLASCQDG